ncbi:unnamed protein product [Cylicocyclus nassatus]|uniref:acid phosphatase n=1 Tax=Cylicocyclus nassatus TaxID=53992 RepID=A0AA36GN64_CYLNA|nr:unnamed protein product [Cylicocyclus nassatus]
MLVNVDRLRSLQQNKAFKKYAIVTASTFIVLVALTFVLLMFKPKEKDMRRDTEASESDTIGTTTPMATSSSDSDTIGTTTPMATSSSDTSQFDKTPLAVITIIREGAHAPKEFKKEETRLSYPNLENELTDLGINDSFELGRYLGKRYVESGFLRKPLLPSEVYFRSRSSSKHLHSAALVGSGMWAGEDGQFTAVPIFSEEENDEIIRSPEEMLCDWIAGIYTHNCEGIEEARDDFKQFNTLYECFYPNTPIPYEDEEKFARVVDLGYKYENGMAVPEWFNDVSEQLYKFNDKAYSFWYCANDFRNLRVLTSLQGPFLSRILDELLEQWNEYEDFGSVRRKFIAYFVEDYLLFTMLHALGCGKAALGERFPKYSAILMLELYKRNEEPVVKLLYKEKTMTSPVDITRNIRGCCSTPCDYEKLADYCWDIRVNYDDRCG